jgi:hypothetical protein
VPRVAFTSHLARHVACPEETVPGATVREALEAYFLRHPPVRSYVFDEQGELRRHVVIFVDGEQTRDRKTPSDSLGDGAEIYVMQALLCFVPVSAVGQGDQARPTSGKRKRNVAASTTGRPKRTTPVAPAMKSNSKSEVRTGSGWWKAAS